VDICFTFPTTHSQLVIFVSGDWGKWIMRILLWIRGLKLSGEKAFVVVNLTKRSSQNNS